MKCPDLGKLRLGLAGELSADEFRPIEVHLDECGSCQAIYRRLVTEGEEPVGRPDPYAAARGVMPAGEGLSTQDHWATLHRPGDAEPASLGRTFVEGYELLSELGRGGMGVVYKARQVKLNRLVALKMILSGSHARPEELARFHREAKAVATLQHPNIVQIHEIGEHEGQPYFSLEFVDGLTLAKKLEGNNPQPPLQAAQLVKTLARAMHVAHERGVVHRDLKPANVLLTQGGVPKVADFGLAKLFDADPSQTKTGAMMGSPSYMAAEQAAGKTKDIGPLSDVYALGVILYEMLTGRTPFKGESIADTLDQVRTQEPVPPSRLQPKVSRDLETICLKCLAKRPADRYATAHALAEDLRRFQAGEPILARPAGWIEKTAKWARRRPALASLAAVVAVVAWGALGFGWWTYWNEVRHGQNLFDALNEKEIQRQLADSNALTAGANARIATQQEAAARRNLYAAHMMVAYREWQRANVGAVRELLKRHIPRPGEEDLRSFEWRFLWGLSHQSLMSLKSPRNLAASVAFSPDGLLLAVAVGNPLGDGSEERAGDILLWDTLTGKLLNTLSGHTKNITGLVFTPDGRRLLSASQDATVRIWDVQTWKTAAILPDRVGPVRALALAPDGRTLVYGGRVEASLSHGEYQGQLCLWDLKEDKEIGCFPVEARGHHGVNRLSFSPAGTLLAIGDDRGAIALWDARDRRTTRTIRAHLGIINGLAFSPDGQTLASASSPAFFSDDFTDLVQLDYSEDGRLLSRSTRGGDSYQVLKQKFRKEGEVKLWHVGGTDLMSLQTALFPATGRVTSLTFSSDGRTLAMGDSDRRVTLWDPSTGLEKNTLRGHSDDIMGLAYSPGGGILVSVGADNVLEFWNPAAASEAALPAVWKDKVDSLSFSSDGAILATGEEGGGGVRLWDVATRTHLAALVEEPSTDFQVAFSPRERILAIGTRQMVKIRPPGEVTLWDVTTRKQIALLGTHQGDVAALAFTPDGQLLVSADERGWAKVWNRHSQKELAHVQVSQLWPRSLAIAPDGKSLAVSETADQVSLWSIPDLQRLGTLDDCKTFGFARDGKTAASFSRKGQLTLWDWPDRKKRISLPGMARNSAPRVNFSPDGKSLISNLLPIRFMDASTGEERFTIEDPENNFRNLVFSPDGNAIAAGTKKVMLWHAAPQSDDLHDPDVPRDLKDHLAKLQPAAATTPPIKKPIVESGPVQELTVGKIEKGNLSKTAPIRTYSISLNAGKSYVVDLTGDFDTLLQIEDSRQEPLLENDDICPPRNLNSRLVFTPERNENYRIIVRSFKGQFTGAFSVQVQEATPMGEPTVFTGKLSDADTKRQNKYFQKHKIQLIGGSPYAIELTSKYFDTYLCLGDPAAKKVIAENDDVAPGIKNRSRIDFTPEADQSFDILVTSFGPAETGAYTVRVQRYELKSANQERRPDSRPLRTMKDG